VTSSTRGTILLHPFGPVETMARKIQLAQGIFIPRTKSISLTCSPDFRTVKMPVTRVPSATTTPNRSLGPGTVILAYGGWKWLRTPQWR
jgi:hypothetical protein